MARPLSPSSAFRRCPWHRTSGSPTGCSECSSHALIQIRCVVCRCLRGAWRSISNIWSMCSSTGPSFGSSRTSPRQSPAASSSGVPCVSSRVPRSSLQPRSRAGSLRIAPLSFSCPSRHHAIRGCPGGPNQMIKVGPIQGSPAISVHASLARNVPNMEREKCLAV